MSPAARRHTRATTVAALLAAVVPWVVVPTASAHDALTGTTPAAGSTLSVAPTAVSLTFAESPMAQGLGVAVTGPDGSRVTSGTPVVRVNEVSQRLLPLTRSGTYTVAYRVVSADGHPVSGTFTFDLALTSVSSPAPTTGPAAPSSTTPAPTASSVLAESAAADGTGAFPWVVGLALVVVGVLAAVLARRRRP